MEFTKIENSYILTQIKADGTVETLPDELSDEGIILDAVTFDGDYI